MCMTNMLRSYEGETMDGKSKIVQYRSDHRSGFNWLPYAVATFVAMGFVMLAISAFAGPVPGTPKTIVNSPDGTTEMQRGSLTVKIDKHGNRTAKGGADVLQREKRQPHRLRQVKQNRTRTYTKSLKARGRSK